MLTFELLLSGVSNTCKDKSVFFWGVSDLSILPMDEEVIDSTGRLILTVGIYLLYWLGWPGWIGGLGGPGGVVVISGYTVPAFKTISTVLFSLFLGLNMVANVFF